MTGSAALSGEDVFEAVHKFTVYWERDFGLATNNKIDRGGLTKNGVSLTLLKNLNLDLNHDGSINKLDVLKCEPEVAKKIFYAEFWMNGKAYCCPPLTAMCFYDFSVNSGYGQVAIFLQKSIDALHPDTIVNYAPNIGPKTREALTHFTKEDHSFGTDLELSLRLLAHREDFVRQIANQDASQKGNLNGWLNRCAGMRKLLNTMYYYY